MAQFFGANKHRVELACQVARMAREQGFEIVNMDAVLVCDKPMISSHRPKIRSTMAEAFGVQTTQVNLKGKTNEELPGRRGVGIEAMVVALLRKRV